MRVVIAMDSFKGTLTAPQACAAVRRGILAARPEVEAVECPMADGGEGTAEVVLAARGGEWVSQRVMGPLPDLEVDAGYAWLPDEPAGALVEMARASGLTLVPEGRQDPRRTTTYGTGQLLAAAARRGAERLWLAVGGSATVDGGTGAARALGWRFLDAAGEPVGLGGGELHRIARIEPPPEVALPPVEVLCDVDNPLLGRRGAAPVFGPQKGATPEMVAELERGLEHLERQVVEQLGVELAAMPGAGAAGGLAGGAVAFFGARLVSGVDAVMDANGFTRRLPGAAWVITGEGRFDEGSLGGKVVSGVARRARQTGARVAVLAGSAELAAERAAAAGIAAVLSAAPPEMPRAEAFDRAAELLAAAARRFAEEYLG